MIDYQIVCLKDEPSLLPQAAMWFHQKWQIELACYQESMQASIDGNGPIPNWYVVLNDEKIIAGLGVIENDFHERKDLTPNVCAVYTEENYRNQGIAKSLLARVCEDMAKAGIDTLYLLTDHDLFYERYGWQFLCMVKESNGDGMSRMYIHQMKQ